MQRNVRQLFSALLFEQLIYRTATTGLVLLVTILRYSKYSPARAYRMYVNNLNSFPYCRAILIHLSKRLSLRLKTKIVFLHFSRFSFDQSIFHVFRTLDAKIRSIEFLYFYTKYYCFILSNDDRFSKVFT